MALLSVSLSHLPSSSSTSSAPSTSSSSFCCLAFSRPSHAVAVWPGYSARNHPLLLIPQIRRQNPTHIVRMAPDEEKMTRRSPLDFPIEWDRPKPGRRPDIFPQFSPMKTPLPPPLPADPPEEDEEGDEEKKEEEDEDPEKEDPDKGDK